MIRRVNYETTRTGLTDREKREPLLPCHSHRQGITCMRITSVEPFILHAPLARGAISDSTNRSEERRVGKECVRKCRFRWSQYHAKQPMTRHNMYAARTDRKHTNRVKTSE